MNGPALHLHDTCAKNLAATGAPTLAALNVLPGEFYAPFVSEAAKTRRADPIRTLLPLEQTTGVISLLMGKPNNSTFPITSLQFTARDPCSPSQDTRIQLTQQDLAVGLQYGPTAGLEELREWVHDLQVSWHGRHKGEGWQVSVGAGSQDLIFKAITALVNPGDPAFIEAPAYAGVIPMFQSLRCEITEVETDAHGICSHKLRTVLETWPSSKPKPKVLYTVPYGSNPTGMTATLERRLEVLALSREHNFIILEDDPYYFLYYGKAPRPPSYFALERDQPEVGRVVRFDSLSKVISSGMRVGFVSGPEAIVKLIDFHTGTANFQPSSFAQIVALKLLQAWGLDGFKLHVEQVAQFYREKRDIFEDAMRRHLTGLAEWTPPDTGMFIWFKLLLSDPSDPSGNEYEHDSESVIRTEALKGGVLTLPGASFFPNNRKTAYARAAFSTLGPEPVNEALRRLREVIVAVRAAKAQRTP